MCLTGLDRFRPDLAHASRDRLLRAHPKAHDLLELLVSDDPAWLQAPLADGVITAEALLHAVARDIEPGEQRSSDRVRRLLAHASLLPASGITPEAIAAVMRFGTSIGEESEVVEGIRLAFESAETPDDDAELVRQAGITLMARLRDQARAQEKRRRIRGEL